MVMMMMMTGVTITPPTTQGGICLSNFSIFLIQLFSEKCTGRYFKVRDDDLSSKQGSLCTFKMILYKLYIYIYLFTLNKIYVFI